ncbi:hypothetical protein HK405_013974 [Cladochytrium tenue]|nr:hypothetical protein HK405_013974 [Cladochytrium tenue]
MLLELPEEILRSILLHLHPCVVQSLRRCCLSLRDLLRLRHASEIDEQPPRTSDKAPRFINRRFALENLRTAIADWPFTDDFVSMLHFTDTYWRRLGPDYLAAMFFDYGFTRTTLMLCLLHEQHSEYHEFASKIVCIYFDDREFLRIEDRPQVRNFMAGQDAHLMTSAARTAMAYLADGGTPVGNLLSDELATWILLADEAGLFELFLRGREKAGVRSAECDQSVLEYAAQMGATRVVRMLVLSSSLCVAPTMVALEAAIRLDDAAMVRLLVSEAPEPLNPRICLNPQLLSRYFDRHHFSAVEALLEPAEMGINATLPCNLEEAPDRITDPNHRDWEKRVSAAIRKLIDTKSIGAESAPSFMYTACVAGDLDLVQELFQFPGAEYSFGHAISVAGINGHAAIVREIIQEAQRRGITIADDIAGVRRREVRDLLPDAAANGLDDVVEALIWGIDNHCIQTGPWMEPVKLADLGGHSHSANLLLRHAIKQSVQKQLEVDICSFTNVVRLDELVDFILGDDPVKVAEVVNSGSTPHMTELIGAAAVHAGATNVLHWAKDRWGLSESALELEAAVFARNPDIVSCLVLYGADPSKLSASTVNYAFRNGHVDVIEALLASPTSKLNTTECNLPAFIRGFATRQFGESLFKPASMRPTFAPRRSRAVLRLLELGCVAPNAAGELVHAACFAGDLALFQRTEVNLSLRDDSIGEEWLENYDADDDFYIPDNFADEVLGGIRTFNAHFADSLHGALRSDNDGEAIKEIQSGQVAILRHMFQKQGFQGASKSILRAKQIAREDSLPMTLIFEFVDEAVRAHIETSCREWSGSKAELYTEELLAFVLLIDDTNRISEYLDTLVIEGARLSDLSLTGTGNTAATKTCSEVGELSGKTFFSTSEKCDVNTAVPATAPVLDIILDLTRKAIDFAAYNCVKLLLMWYPRDTPVDKLITRAVATISVPIARLLLSESGQSWAVERPLESLLRKENKKSVADMLEVFAEQSSWKGLWLDIDSLISSTSGPVTEAETRLRRRALSSLLVIWHRNKFDSESQRSSFLPTLCGLGWEPPVANLLHAAPPATKSGWQKIMCCVRRAASAGEADVVVHLLAAIAAVTPQRLLEAFDAALESAASSDRLDVVVRIFEGPSEVRPPDNELVHVIRLYRRRNVKAPRTSPAVSRYLHRALARISSALPPPCI